MQTKSTKNKGIKKNNQNHVLKIKVRIRKKTFGRDE